MVRLRKQEIDRRRKRRKESLRARGLWKATKKSAHQSHEHAHPALQSQPAA